MWGITLRNILNWNYKNVNLVQKIQEHRSVNRMFLLTPKKVYRSMRGESTEPEKEMPTKEETQNFWKSLWGEPLQHNQDAPWIKILEEEYRVDARQQNYEITDEVLDKVINRMAND